MQDLKWSRPVKQHRHILLVSFVFFCVTISFYPLAEPASLVSHTLNTARILEISLLLVSAVTITAAVLYRRCPIVIAGGALPVITFTIILFAMFSGFWSIDPFLTFVRAGMLLILLYIAIATSIYIRDVSSNSIQTTMQTMTYALLGSAVILIVANIPLWGTPFPFTEASLWSNRQGRLYFAHVPPLETGEFLSLVIVIAAFGIRPLALRLGVILALFLLLHLTHSRSLMLFTPLALAAGLFQRSMITVRFVLISAAICVISVLVIFFVLGDAAKYIPPDFWTLNGRIPLWELAVAQLEENPFVGVGYYASRYYLTNADFAAGHAHNAYIETAMCLGLIGVALLIVFLAYCIRYSTADKTGFLTATLTLCCLGSIFNPMIFNSTPHTLYLFGIVFAVAQDALR